MTDHTPDNSVLTISLSKGFTTVISVADRDLCDVRWSASVSPKRRAVYAYRGEPGNNKHKLYLGRVILGRILKRDLLPGETCHYVNGNSLDNTRENLALKPSKRPAREVAFTTGDN